MTALDQPVALTSLTGAQARVVRRRRLSDTVIELDFELVDGITPAWAPGAHIDLCLADGTIRQYSLCGDPEEQTLRVAVLREQNGRGGSEQIHSTLHEGSAITINGPRNHFALADADSYVFVAGGIGITPILAMIREATRRNRPWRLFYGGRTRSSMAYLPEMEQLVVDAGEAGRVDVVPEDESGLLDLAAVADAAAGGIPVYACGPEPMLAALEARVGRDLGQGQLRLERFGAASGVKAVADDGGLEEFEVVIASTDQVLPVGPDDRLIDIVRSVAPQVPFSCEEGYCGSCETGVLEGLPCHRDQVLTDDERAANDTMMICVGRSRTTRLVLDL
ncbi:PDR/VanB family oxidoreductase [Streptomyces sp. NPDC001663]|uniref:PDR/VanB family oxidoreductase n=1 Tax=Streptomyces sp. NPDC001663 TaxID=3364597 RepID=UPI00367BA8DC